MGKRRGTEKRKLDALLNVRMPMAMHSAILNEADRMGITTISLCRKILADALPHIDPADAISITAPLKFEMPSIVHELAHAREAAAELTGQLVQAAKRYRESGDAEAHHQAEQVLTLARRATGELLDLGDEIARGWKEMHRRRDAVQA